MAKRVYSQYRNKPKLVQWIEITETMAAAAETEFQAIRDTYNVDTQDRAQLDVIGRVVGIDRSNIPPSLDQDAAFRTLIRAKIFKNNATGTIDDAFTAILFIFPDLSRVTVLDFEDMSFGFSIDESLTDDERYLLINNDIMPRPQGVRFLGFFETAEVIEFGDDEAEFGDTDAEFAGFTEVNY